MVHASLRIRIRWTLRGDWEYPTLPALGWATRLNLSLRINDDVLGWMYLVDFAVQHSYRVCVSQMVGGAT
jgi:hypothetical protein